MTHNGNQHSDDDCCDCTNSTIIVNNRQVFIHPGAYALATIKKLSGVPLADDLDELLDCRLKPIPDDATLKIRGCEIFVSHVKDGGSA